VLGSIPFAFNVVYASVKRVQKEVKPVIWIYASIAVITLVGSYLLAQRMGIIGVGYAWVLANGLVCVFIVLKHRAYF